MVSGIVVDLNAKRVPHDIKVWRLFPGKYYKFLPDFLEKSLVFMDFPGLALPNGALSLRSNTLRPRILASKAIEEWIARRRLFDLGLAPGNPPEPPSRAYSSYEQTGAYDGLPGDMGAIRKLFGRAKRGDLVIVPERGRLRTFNIGEFIDEPENRVSIKLGQDYYNESTPARKINWFPPVDEFRIPIDLSSKLRTQNSLIEISNEFLLSVLDAAYGTYYLDGEYACRFQTQAQEFSDQDALDIGLLVKLATSIASDMRHGVTPNANINFYIRKLIPEEDRISISVNINSPGILSSKSGFIAPLLLSVLFSLFATGDANSKPAAENVQIVNSAAVENDKCTADINQAVAETLNNMLFEEWKANCERSARLAKEPRLRGDSRVHQQR